MKLPRRILIQRRVAGTDALNQPTGAWEDVRSLWADPRGLAGMSVIKAGLPVDVVDLSWRVRYRPTGVDVGMRVAHTRGGATVYYDIKSLRHDEANREWTDLVCQRGGNDG